MHGVRRWLITSEGATSYYVEEEESTKLVGTRLARQDSCSCGEEDGGRGTQSVDARSIDRRVSGVGMPNRLAACHIFPPAFTLLGSAEAGLWHG